MTTSSVSTRCRDLVRRYRSGFQLGPIDLSLTPGVTCLVGANGAGKSTFFRLVAGVDRPTSGSVEVSAGDRRTGIGYLPQEPSMPATARCDDFLAYVAWLHRMPRRDRSAAVTEALRRVGLEQRAGMRIGELSGGMRRRLGIAHALVHRPGLVLLDEPTAGLDPRQRALLRATIAEVAADRAVLVSTHLVEDVRGLADRVIVLADGAVRYDGDVTFLQDHAEEHALGDTPLERALATLMGGHE
jgi:ABC-2 type transport system ATP-binding protein